MNKIAFEQRNKEILKDRNNGMTYTQLGKKYGISRQGVEWVLRKHFKGEFKHRVYFSTKFVKFICKQCGKEMSRYQIDKPVFCSRQCAAIAHRVYRTPQEKREHHNRRLARYYHNVLKLDPVYIENKKRLNREYALKHKRSHV